MINTQKNKNFYIIRYLLHLTDFTKGQCLYQAYAKWCQTIFINLALEVVRHGASEVMKVANQMSCLAVVKQLKQPGGMCCRGLTARVVL